MENRFGIDLEEIVEKYSMGLDQIPLFIEKQHERKARKNFEQAYAKICEYQIRWLIRMMLYHGWTLIPPTKK